MLLVSFRQLYFDRRLTSCHRVHLARRAPGKLQVPVDLWIAHLSAVSRLKYFQHWSLVIDTKHAFSAEAEDSGVPAPLAVKSFMYSSDKKDKLTSIDCHAEFKNQAELNRVLGELVSMKMTLMPSHKGKNFQDGGTCMNYVWNALEHLRKGGHIPEITKKFVEIFNRDYQKVKDEVWPGS